MTYPRPPSMPMGIVVISWVHPSVQLSVGLGFGVADKLLVRKSTFWHADVSRWVTLRLLTLMDITVRLSIGPAIWVWVCWVWVWLGEGCHTLPGDGCCHHWGVQATGLDAWASKVKCPARFVSHLHEIYIYIYELFIAFVSFVVCSLL